VRYAGGEEVAMAEQELVPLTEAAQRLGISRVTMSQLAKAGRFTVYENPRDRRQRLVDMVEVTKALAPRPIERTPNRDT